MKRLRNLIRSRGRDRRSLLTNFAGGVGIQLALLVSGVVLARALGPIDRGNMALLTLVSAMAWQLGGLGIPYALTYAAARVPGAAKRSRESVSRPIAIQAFLAAGTAAVALALLTAGRPAYVREGAAFAVFAIVAMVYVRCSLGILQGLRQFLSFNVLRMAPTALFSTTAAALWLAGIHALLPYAIAWSLCQVIVAPIVVAYSRRAATGVETDEPEPLSRGQLLSFGRRSLFGGDPPVETYRVDQAAVALFLAPSSLGFYVAALAFTNLPRFIAQSFSLVATPSIAGQPTHRRAVRAMWRFFLAAIPFYMLLVAILWIAAPLLVEFFFGPAFARSATISRILLLATALYCARRVLSDSARGAGYPGIGSVAEVSSILSAVGMFAAFIPLWGVNGVAWALVGSSAVALVALLVGVTYLTRKRAVPPSWVEIHGKRADIDGLVAEP